jgi:RimJ/RimL family protein N-acetyltransferase
MIATPRLFVRRLSPADYSSFAVLENDAEVKKFSGGARLVPLESYTRLLSEDSDACLAICAQEDGRFVGRCGFRSVGDRVELEIFLAQPEQGHRFGPELFDAMLSHCASAYPKARPAATLSPANSRAVELLKRHGFTDSGETVLTKTGFQSVYVQTI